MDEVDELLRAVLGTPGGERLSYAEAFSGTPASTAAAVRRELRSRVAALDVPPSRSSTATTS